MAEALHQVDGKKAPQDTVCLLAIPVSCTAVKHKHKVKPCRYIALAQQQRDV